MKTTTMTTITTLIPTTLHVNIHIDHIERITNDVKSYTRPSDTHRRDLGPQRGVHALDIRRTWA
jgi:hypothetical protein